MLMRVTLHTVGRELSNNTFPILLACIHPNTAIKPQVEMLEYLSKVFGQRLKVCLLCEKISAVMRDTYGIEGTPTYLLVKEHTVIDRLLGQVDRETLTGFVSRAFRTRVQGGAC
jgi:hypothetical protein